MLEHFMNSVMCPVLYLGIGAIVAAANDAHRHLYAESLTGSDTEKARRICLWGWAADIIMWPMYGFGALCTGLGYLMNRRRP
jgi:hypothetical protein